MSPPIPTKQELPPGHTILERALPSKRSQNAIIGAKGSTVKRLYKKYNVDIHFRKVGSATHVYICGPDAGVKAAAEEIELISQPFEEAEEKRKAREARSKALGPPEPHDLNPNEKTVQVVVPKKVSSLVVQKWKDEIKPKVDECDVKSSLQKAKKSGNQMIVVWGQKSKVDNARNRIIKPTIDDLVHTRKEKERRKNEAKKTSKKCVDDASQSTTKKPRDETDQDGSNEELGGH